MPEKPDPTTDTEPELDPALIRMWETPVAKRGPKPGLSVDRIVTAAYGVADAEGLAAVSMARLGQELGVTAMALYRHVASKDELLALLADRFAAELPRLSDDLDWREGLRRWTRLQIDAAIAHPWMLDLPLTTSAVGPNRVQWLDQGFKVLREVAIPAGEKLRLLGMLAQHVLGEARVQSDAMTSGDDPWAGFVPLLMRYSDVVPAADLQAAFPGATESELAELADDDDQEAEIGFGIDIVLDGVEAYLRRAGAIT